MFDSVMQIAILTIFPIAMVLAASSDLFTMTVSNRLTGGLAAAFMLRCALACWRSALRCSPWAGSAAVMPS